MSMIPYKLPARRLLVLFASLATLVVFPAEPQTLARQPSSVNLGRTRNTAQITGPRVPIPGGWGGKSSSDKLAKSGPVFPEVFSMSSFFVEGLLVGGWSVVIEYELEGESTAEVVIGVRGTKQSFIIKLAPTNGQPIQITNKLPEIFSQKPQAGVVSFKALKNGPDPRKPALFVLSGLGFGPNAVSSMVIDQPQFQPGSINATGKEKATYSFRSLNDFNLASAEFVRVTNVDGDLKLDFVYRETFKDGVRRGERVSREWDGKNKKNKISLGLHQVWIRVWRNLKSGGDWSIGSTKQRVKVV